MINTLINPLRIWKTDFHFLWMHINIHQLRRNRKMQHCKWISVLHSIRLISVLNRFMNCRALNISAVNKIIHIIAVASGNDRFADKSLYLTAHLTGIHLQKIWCNILTINMIYDVFQISISRSMKLCLILIDKPEGNIRMGQRKTFDQGIDISRLCRGRFQKFQTRRCIKEEITDQNCSAIRTSHRLQSPLFSTVCFIAAAHQLVSGLCYHLQLWYRRNAGESLTSKTKSRHPEQILGIINLTCSVRCKCQTDILLIHPHSVVRHTDQCLTAVLHLYGDRIGISINRIFRQFLYHCHGSFDHLTGSNLINGILIQNMYLWHSVPTFLSARNIRLQAQNFSGSRPDIILLSAFTFSPAASSASYIKYS